MTGPAATSLPQPSPDAVGAGGAGARDSAVEGRRLAAVRSGFVGDADAARALLDDEVASVRVAALAALARMGSARTDDARAGAHDPAATVRRAACELAPQLPPIDWRALLDDDDDRVVEACAHALGELHDARAIEQLGEIAAHHTDALCREAAVAALGAIGDDRAAPVLLAALDDVAAIRRRAVIALSQFSGSRRVGAEVTAALLARRHDRDWQVRQAAEDLAPSDDER